MTFQTSRVVYVWSLLIRDTFLTRSEQQNSKKNLQYFKTTVPPYGEKFFSRVTGLLSSRSAVWRSLIKYGSTAVKLASYSVSHIQPTEWFLQQSQRSCFSVKGKNKIEINLSSRFSMTFLWPQTLAARSTLHPLNMWEYFYLLNFSIAISCHLHLKTVYIYRSLISFSYQHNNTTLWLHINSELSYVVTQQLCNHIAAYDSLKMANKSRWNMLEI